MPVGAYTKEQIRELAKKISLMVASKPDSQEKFLEAIAEICHGKDRYQKERQECNLFFNEIQKPCMKKICDEVKKHVGMDEN